MDKISTVTGIAVPLKRSNVDTDQIIPAVFLKRVTKTGFEDALFSAWRQDPEFVLNQPGLPEPHRTHRRCPPTAAARSASPRTGSTPGCDRCPRRARRRREQVRGGGT